MQPGNFSFLTQSVILELQALFGSARPIRFDAVATYPWRRLHVLTQVRQLL